MVRVLLKAFANIVGRPLILLPAIAAALVNHLVFVLTFFAGTEILADILEFGFPLFSLAEMPFRFYSLNFWQINIVLAGLFINMAVLGLLTVFYARFVRLREEGTPSAKSAFSFAVSKLGRIVSTIVFFAVVGIIFSTVLWLLLMLLSAGLPLADVLVLLFLLLIVYVTVKLVLVFTAIGFEDLQTKQAVAASWSFTGRHFWGTVWVVFLIAVVYAVFSGIGSIAMEQLADDFQVMAVYYFFSNILISAVSGLAFAEHYKLKSRK